jgi:hypothetical protein
LSSDLPQYFWYVQLSDDLESEGVLYILVELKHCPPCCSFHEQEDKDISTEKSQHMPKEHFGEDTQKYLWLPALSPRPSYLLFT